MRKMYNSKNFRWQAVTGETHELYIFPAIGYMSESYSDYKFFIAFAWLDLRFRIGFFRKKVDNG